MNDALIAQGNWDRFLTLTNEELLLVLRRHIFVILLPIFFTSIGVVIFLFGAFFLFIQFFNSIPFFIISALLIIGIGLSLITKIIIDWYFHIYIFTNRKILEIWYTPLASHSINDILLDKVNCTEIDLKVDGFFNELLEMGDVVITFDRPTHEEEFILKDIYKPDNIEKFLTRRLMDHQTKDSLSPMWFRERSFSRHS
jgi:hypothetical protein